MTLYSVLVGYDSAIYFATQREAFDYARTETKRGSGDADSKFVDEHFAIVERVQLVPLTKAVIVQLVNVSGGYVDTTTEIARFANGKRVKS